jgi:hypothetical protein
VSLPKFVGVIADPVQAFVQLVFGGKTLWFQPDSKTLIEVSYRAPYYRIRTFREGAPHLEVFFTPDAGKVIELLRKHVAYLAE